MPYKYMTLDDESLQLFLPLLDERSKQLCEENKDLLKIGAVNEDYVPSGVLFIIIHYEGFGEIRYMYTAEPERKKGLMKGMFRYISSVLSIAGIHSLYLIRINDRSDGQDKSINCFCDNMGGKVQMITDHLVSVRAKEILKKTGRMSKQCTPISDIQASVIKEALYKVEIPALQRLYYFIDKCNGDIKEAFDPASCALLGKEGIGDFMLFIPREAGSGVTLVYLKGQEPKSLAMLLGCAARNAMDRFGEDAYISFATINGIGSGMGKIFKDDRIWVTAERVVFMIDDLL